MDYRLPNYQDATPEYTIAGALSEPSILGALADPQFWRDMGRNAQGVLSTPLPALLGRDAGQRGVLSRRAEDPNYLNNMLGVVGMARLGSTSRMSNSIDELLTTAKGELKSGKAGKAYETILSILRNNESRRPELLSKLYPQWTDAQKYPSHPWAQDIWLEANKPQKAGIGLARINYPELSSIIRGVD